MRAEFFRQLGNICYLVNGGLAKVNNHSIMDKLTFYFWSKSYGLIDGEVKND